MARIRKIVLDEVGPGITQTATAPIGLEPLSAEFVQGKVRVYAIADPTGPEGPAQFQMYEEGELLGEGSFRIFVGSARKPSSTTVKHVFMRDQSEDGALT